VRSFVRIPFEVIDALLLCISITAAAIAYTVPALAFGSYLEFYSYDIASSLFLYYNNYYINFSISRRVLTIWLKRQSVRGSASLFMLNPHQYNHGDEQGGQ
jgi:hypothetical protein